MIELLESRIAPASVVVNAAAKTATWNDHDGDVVSLKWTSAAPPVFATSDIGIGVRIDKITLNAAEHSNASFTLKVKAGPNGDGRIDLGRVEATGVPLKSWSSPNASIAEFDAGNGTVGVGTLSIGPLGLVAYNNFAATGGDGTSAINGAVSKITVKGDIGATKLEIAAGTSAIKSIAITGSLRGDFPESQPTLFAGKLSVAAKSIGSLILGGSIIGGDESGEGSLITNAKLTNLVIKGSILGGTGTGTGYASFTNVTKALIGRDLQGGSAGATGVVGFGDVARLTIGGDILGGEKDASGYVSTENVGTLTIKGSIRGAFGTDAAANSVVGALFVNKSAKSITVAGDLVAGTFGSGTKVEYNGAIFIGGNVASLSIKGSILGNENTDAFILARGTAPTTPGDVKAIGKLQIGGDVSYGYIAAGHQYNLSAPTARIGTAENPDAGIGSVTVNGNWFHSNLAAGINDTSSNGPNPGDTRDVGDALHRAAIGPVVIRGYVMDEPLTDGFSGIVAEKIASVIVGGTKVFKTGDPARSLDPYHFIDILEM